MDGILNINKPAGVTSFKIVSLVRHLTGERRVGHAGTLDPLACGVLPVCFGRATRVIEFLMDAQKTYRAVIELGIATDTYDIEGTVIREKDASSITRQDIESALCCFLGAIEQEPPMYSALKHNGQCLYKLARAGIAVERKKRQVYIYRLELVDYNPPFVTIEMECSKGTYVRSLANDLGERLGCGACVTELVRLKYGPFDIEEAVSVFELKDAFSGGEWQRLVYPVDFIMKQWESVTVGDEQERFIRNGVSVILEDTNTIANDKYCAYDEKGSLLAILNFDAATGKWKPQKVFN
ncbi:MAG: tRNA pseudouridine(55) synthase TruB [Dehalococcoidales bacterium]|nr:tRNA pseudouridine(55) synthase TruB [Dehalococcoidales bacterium]